MTTAAPPQPEYCAQFGEDRLIHEHYGEAPGFYVEIGAADGRNISNTWFFEQRGWTGLLIEAHPETAATCKANRPGSTVAHCAVVAPAQAGGTVSFTLMDGNDHYSALAVDQELQENLARWTGNASVRTVEVPARTLDSLLEELSPSQIHFMTLDVEGFEADVLRGFTFERWRPRFLIIERNDNWSEVFDLCHAAGYRHIRTTGVNDWFVPQAEAGVADWVYFPRYAAFKGKLKAAESAVKARKNAGALKRKVLKAS